MKAKDMKLVTLVTNPETGRVDLASRVTTPLHGVTFTNANVPIDLVTDDEIEKYLEDTGYLEPNTVC